MIKDASKEKREQKARKRQQMEFAKQNSLAVMQKSKGIAPLRKFTHDMKRMISKSKGSGEDDKEYHIHKAKNALKDKHQSIHSLTNMFKLQR